MEIQQMLLTKTGYERVIWIETSPNGFDYRFVTQECEHSNIEIPTG